ncbi:alpha-catulin isoform X2 [Harmonia axyridis]|uniref:alpha-catulin isoform X2 n=1 Tax=Harmonia axyridis TaxID=115357 RepID=UPI001E275122|nr:alpha-catulin isoform X2 [Harmonia axyridis]XP_045464587.1 alpha-catulin isoform X2 [Harmonia axyridis]
MAAVETTNSDCLEIKTRSIEQALLPLIKQISSLVEQHGSSPTGGLRPGAVARVGQAVNLAVERFVTVGETIADDYPEVRQGMYEACKEARQAGSAIESICEETQEAEKARPDRTVLIRASRCLLGAITRVLLLADIVVVKQLLLAKDKVSHSLDRLESVNNFTEFVKAFSQFGSEMVELAHLTGDRQNDLKDERRRAQMAAARQVLERSTMMLLTSSKTCLRHPDCSSSRENRDTVFCQMRRAMDLIHFVVKDGVLNSGDSHVQREELLENERATAYSCLRHLTRLLEVSKVTMDSSCQETIPSGLEAVLERTQDFTDSAYTSHEHREAILERCDRLKLELDHLLGLYANVMGFEEATHSPEIEASVSACIDAVKEVSKNLAIAASNQAQELSTATKQGLELVGMIKQEAAISDINRLHHTSNAFQDSIDHILEVCKLLRHVAVSETHQISAKFTEINLRVYGPQVITAAKTLAGYPGSKIAQENLEVFADMYQWLVSDVTAIVKDVLETSQGKPEKQVYMSLPRPGKHGTTSKPVKSVRLDVDEQEKIAKSGLEMKLITNEMDAETDKWQESNNAQVEENNDIVKRAKNMSAMAFSMYQFTKGEGELKTTQDLFTQAEYFAEEANRLYKVIRQFSYQVPGGANKKELLENLDKVPTFVQRLQFTVKDHTVGKAATFTKVDNVIQETKNLMNVISKVVTTCFECATKYKITMPRRVRIPCAAVEGPLPNQLSPQALQRLANSYSTLSR